MHFILIVKWINFLFIISLDSCPRSWWAVGFIMLATGCCTPHSCITQSTESTQNGCNRFGRSICQNLFAMQRTTYCQEEDTCKETHTQSRIQRKLRIWYSSEWGKFVPFIFNVALCKRHPGISFPHYVTTQIMEKLSSSHHKCRNFFISFFIGVEFSFVICLLGFFGVSLHFSKSFSISFNHALCTK